MQLKCITLGSSIALEGLCYSKLSHVRRFSSFCNRSCKILKSIHTIARRRCILSDWVSVSCQILSFVDPVGPSNFFGPSENNKLGEFPISQFWVGVPHHQPPLFFFLKIVLDFIFIPISLFYFFLSIFSFIFCFQFPNFRFSFHTISLLLSFVSPTSMSGHSILWNFPD